MLGDADRQACTDLTGGSYKNPMDAAPADDSSERREDNTTDDEAVLTAGADSNSSTTGGVGSLNTSEQHVRTWARRIGMSPDSNVWLRRWCAFCVSFGAFVVSIVIFDSLFFNPPSVQNTPGEPMPLLTFTQNNKTIINSIREMGVTTGHVFGESCCAAEQSGAPVRFGTRDITLEPEHITLFQFELAKLAHNSNISDAYLKLEATGHRWGPFQGDRFRGKLDEALDVVIRAELSEHSIPARFENNNIANREVTLASVPWSVPVTNGHSVIQTPDLSPLLMELQGLRGWERRSTVTIIIAPASNDEKGGREFKVLFTSADAMGSLVDEILGYFIGFPAIYFVMTRYVLFGDDDELENTTVTTQNRWLHMWLLVWRGFFTFMSVMFFVMFFQGTVANKDQGAFIVIITAISALVWPFLCQYMSVFCAAFCSSCLYRTNRIKETAKTLDSEPFDFTRCMHAIDRINEASGIMNNRYAGHYNRARNDILQTKSMCEPKTAKQKACHDAGGKSLNLRPCFAQ